MIAFASKGKPLQIAVNAVPGTTEATRPQKGQAKLRVRSIPAPICGIDWLLLPQRRCLIDTVTAPLNFTFVEHLRPPCSKCSRPLILTRFEPEKPGFGLRIYYCAACEANETIIVPV